jgi:hypothetical protein
MTIGNPFWQIGTTYILPILRPPWFRPGLSLEPSPGRPSLVSFRILDDGLITYEATKVDLMPKGTRGEK